MSMIDRVRSDNNFHGLGWVHKFWVGFKKTDPCPILFCPFIGCFSNFSATSRCPIFLVYVLQPSIESNSNSIHNTPHTRLTAFFP